MPLETVGWPIPFSAYAKSPSAPAYTCTQYMTLRGRGTGGDLYELLDLPLSLISPVLNRPKLVSTAFNAALTA